MTNRMQDAPPPPTQPPRYTPSRSEPSRTYTIDFAQPFVVVAIVLMMRGRIPFTPRNVGALIIASMFHVTAEWEL